jgi:DNA-binding response OmpR family regulator
MKQKVDLLYVEDNEDYVDFVGRAVKKIDENIGYKFVTDGKDAFEYFQSNASGNSMAKLILLDINLPGMNGIDLLKKIRSISHLKYLPVIIFSTSESPDDIKASYDNGANAYIVKPVGINSLTDTLKKICDFWLSLNYCYN